LAVVKIVLPPLRQRPEDIPAIIEQFVPSLGITSETAEWLRTPEFFATVKCASWPGNVRELRNYLERCSVFGSALPTHEGDEGRANETLEPIDLSTPFLDAREKMVAGFERRYLDALLRAHKWKVGEAALAAGIDRVFLWRLLRRHGLSNPNR
jgi:DNA-binding NtrC family response regulator